MLLGLLRAEGKTAPRVLRTFGVELEQTRAEVVRAIGTGDCLPTGRSLPFTLQAEGVLDSLREALDLEHSYIRTEHILIGLLRERSGLAARLLRNLSAPRPDACVPRPKQALSSG